MEKHNESMLEKEFDNFLKTLPGKLCPTHQREFKSAFYMGVAAMLTFETHLKREDDLEEKAELIKEVCNELRDFFSEELNELNKRAAEMFKKAKND